MIEIDEDTFYWFNAPRELYEPTTLLNGMLATLSRREQVVPDLVVIKPIQIIVKPEYEERQVKKLISRKVVTKKEQIGVAYLLKFSRALTKEERHIWTILQSGVFLSPHTRT